MKLYAVGGAIRDTQMGLPMHDVDYVVVGSSVAEMLANGFRPVGKDFPVFLHPKTHAEYALARTERKTGVGYKGFLFHADPSVTLEQDLARRDLTINAMAQEVLEDGQLVGPIIDPFNGQGDLATKVFRHVSDAFSEDPLRLLRIARFAARFPEFTVAPETLDALRVIAHSGELKALSPERVWQELARGFVADKPMRMFQVLLDAEAAATIFPSTLVAELLQEASREMLKAHFHLADTHLDERCAVVLMGLAPSEIRAWSERVRMPIDVRDFSEIFSALAMLVRASLNESFLAVDVVAWFNRADVWRKPERGQALLLLAQKLGLQIDGIMMAMQQAQALNMAEILATVPQEERANGERIRSAVEAARLAVITSAL